MTTAERLRAEGRLEGEAKGLARGRTEGRTELLTEFLTAKFGPVPAHVAEVIAAGDAADILTWLGRASTADKLTEVFDR